jgi:hypothetical protein
LRFPRESEESESVSQEEGVKSWGVSVRFFKAAYRTDISGFAGSQ